MTKIAEKIAKALAGGTKPGSSTLSRRSIGILLALYCVLGFFLGWTWKSGDPITPYHQWYYNRFELHWKDVHWLGYPFWKSPLDAWIYQEIIYETRPDVLVEAGTWRGGSAYYFASLFDLLNHGRVLTIDIERYPNLPKDDRITYLLGSSTSDAIFQTVKDSIQPGEKVMVVLDSSHFKPHVLKEIELYRTIVTVGNYLVVEDTNLNGHPVYPNYGPGPMEAVQEFLTTNSNFVQDRSREKFGFTMFPGGWLKRVR